MPSSTRISCPYCREEIPGDASVCRHCRREVRLVLDARAEIEQLKAQLALRGTAAESSVSDPTQGVGLRVDPSGTVSIAAIAVNRERWFATTVLLVFYLLPAPVTVLSPDLPGGSYLPLVLGMLAGGVLAYYARSNLWMLMIYGFAQPFVPLLGSLVFQVITVQDIVDFPLWESARLGVTVTLAGAATLLLLARDRLAEALRLEVPTRWLDRTEAGLGRVTNFIAAVVTLLGVLLKLLD